jgi:hypothetical protein
MVYYRANSYNSDMFLVGILSWWYGNGWLSRIQLIKERLAASADFFSVGLLASTLFAPFRQISVGRVSGPIGDQIRAFFDRLISRIVGGFVRTFMIVFGLVAMFIQVVFGGIVLLLWLILPLLPVVGLIATVIGWVPRG